jgi:hypothetical protein
VGAIGWTASVETPDSFNAAIRSATCDFDPISEIPESRARHERGCFVLAAVQVGVLIAIARPGSRSQSPAWCKVLASRPIPPIYKAITGTKVHEVGHIVADRQGRQGSRPAGAATGLA